MALERQNPPFAKKAQKGWGTLTHIVCRCSNRRESADRRAQPGPRTRDVRRWRRGLGRGCGSRLTFASATAGGGAHALDARLSGQ